MIFSNICTIGCVVSFQHDIADIPCSIAKYFGCTIYKNTSVLAFIILMIVWFYTRLVLLPYVIYRMVTENMWLPEPFEDCSPIVGFTAGFLSVMLFLHYYWFYIFIQMVTTYKEKGATEDLQNDITKKA